MKLVFRRFVKNTNLIEDYSGRIVNALDKIEQKAPKKCSEEFMSN